METKVNDEDEGNVGRERRRSLQYFTKATAWAEPSQSQAVGGGFGLA
jgi:hypothetical protein